MPTETLAEKGFFSSLRKSPVRTDCVCFRSGCILCARIGLTVSRWNFVHLNSLILYNILPNTWQYFFHLSYRESVSQSSSQIWEAASSSWAFDAVLSAVGPPQAVLGYDPPRGGHFSNNLLFLPKIPSLWLMTLLDLLFYGGVPYSAYFYSSIIARWCFFPSSSSSPFPWCVGKWRIFFFFSFHFSCDKFFLHFFPPPLQGKRRPQQSRNEEEGREEGKGHNF